MAFADRRNRGAPFFALDERDRARAADLTRIKALATGVLVASVALLVFARVMQPRHPAFGYLAAFAEAATIGGVADWYAVVVLFRRPLGLPIPHTAIIPENQARIAEKLGAFIESHFLAPAPVAAKLHEVDFAHFVSDWLADDARREAFARYLLRLLPDVFAALEQSGLKTFATRRILSQLDQLDITPFASGLLKGVVADGQHQKLLDDLLGALAKLIHTPETLSALGEKIRDELPSLLRLSRADTFLVKRIVASVSSFLEEVRADEAHPFRGEFDRFLRNYVDQLTTSPGYRDQLDRLKRSILLQPEFGALASQAWGVVRAAIDEAATGDNTALQTQLQRMLSEMGRHLSEDTELRGEINSGMVVVLTSFVESQKKGVSKFIADQVKSWDIEQLVTLIEINIGRDLQYIRFNGALIGGLAGIMLHAGEQVLRIG